MKWWENYPWRLIQTNLREIDFKGLDPERFVQDLKSFHATVALINAGGISASYPTKLPWQAQNPWAVNDSLKHLVELCHENSIRVIARTDFSKVKEDIWREHQDWAFRDADGAVMNYNGYVQTCINSEYQQKYAFEILQEIFETIPFDGLFCNMGGFQSRDYDFVDYGFCHCKACQEKFRAMSGYDLPQKEDFGDPVYVNYTVFQKKILKQYRQKMVRFLKEMGRDLCFDDEDYARIEASTELHRRLPHWQYHASSNCRVILGDGTKDIICSDTSVEYMGYALRDVAVAPELQKLREWQNLTNLGGLDYYLMGRIDNHQDRSGFGAIKEVFGFHAQNQEHYIGLKNQAKVLLVRNDRWVATEEEKGWIRTLTESHIPFAELLPTDLKDAMLSKYRLVILPDHPYLSQMEADKLDAYVEGGGILLTTGQTGLFDERKGYRKEPALRCQGISRIYEMRSNMASSMFLVQGKDKKYFPSFKDIDVIALGDRYIFMEEVEGTEKLLPMVPVHPYGPPECCYYTEITTQPCLYIRQEGEGRAVTIPWYPGEFYARTGHSNLYLFMKDVLTALCGAKTLSDTLPEMVEVSLAQKKNGTTMVQLVNNSGSFGLSWFSPLPVYDAAVRVPWTGEVQNVYSLKKTPVVWKREEKMLYIVLEKLDEYDAVIIEKG